jgi:hypothetical protein
MPVDRGRYTVLIILILEKPSIHGACLAYLASLGKLELVVPDPRYKISFHNFIK